MLLKLKEKANLTLAVGTLPLPPLSPSSIPGECARWLAGEEQGDSGGPLLCAGVAQGIVSYGLSNEKPPAVFTRISPYRPWIDEVLKEN
ncbi:hypothetical protein MG293_014573 [Ovis ammon polii]|uniref:Peptidase S1 domain-containing protein n=1 Tax=Ovis ammon polii TaxID=230172 RepID=A0AAD4Y5N9_OVIAM|nr:hypothetical protein MG293_014573 [Ovis ammon polii]KAI4560235.1 hypothetical protein MJT46_012473 [Ovis ammon polii x Ovis aries]